MDFNKIKQLAVPYFCDIFMKPNGAFVLFSQLCKKKCINYPHMHMNLHFIASTLFSPSTALKTKTNMVEANKV